MYEEDLVKLGLTEGEAKVYSCLLKLGSSTVGPIVKNSKVAYSNIYEILDRLMHKGIVSYITKQKTRYYQALQPSRLKDYLRSKQNEITLMENRLNEILPKLSSLNKKHESTSAEIYIGKKGLLTAYENLMENTKKGDIIKYFYSYTPQTYKQIHEFYYQLFPKLKTLKIIYRGIVNNEFKSLFQKETSPSFLQARFVNFPVPSNIDVFNDKILITTWENTPTAILIISREVADSFTAYFDKVWETAKN